MNNHAPGIEWWELMRALSLEALEPGYQGQIIPFLLLLTFLTFLSHDHYEYNETPVTSGRMQGRGFLALEFPLAEKTCTLWVPLESL